MTVGQFHPKKNLSKSWLIWHVPLCSYLSQEISDCFCKGQTRWPHKAPCGPKTPRTCFSMVWSFWAKLRPTCNRFFQHPTLGLHVIVRHRVDHSWSIGPEPNLLIQSDLVNPSLATTQQPNPSSCGPTNEASNQWHRVTQSVNLWSIFGATIKLCKVEKKPSNGANNDLRANSQIVFSPFS
jgi:hypothetical protein